MWRDCRPCHGIRSPPVPVDRAACKTPNCKSLASARKSNARVPKKISELSPGHATWTETTLYTFCASAPCSDGAYPRGGLRMDANRNLLGVTVSGGNACIDGAEGCGVAFKLVPNGAQSTYTVLLYTFCALNDCRDGANPSSPLFQNSGNLLGTTLAGGKP